MDSTQRRDTRITEVLVPADGDSIQITIADSAVPAGFPSPVDDSRETLDIASHIVRNKASTFFMRVSGESMTGAGIYDGDLLIVDRSLEARHGDIVVAVLNGEFTVKRLSRRDGRVELHPANADYRKITVTEEMDFEVWGVVTGSFKSFR